MTSIAHAVSALPTADEAAAKTGRFFLPGPTEVRADVLDAMRRQMIGHRGAQIEALIERCGAALKLVFRTTRPVYIATASATGLMEGAIRNGARKKVLSLVNGAFSERFFHIAKACGMEADAYEVPLGQAHDPSVLRETLKKKDYDAVTMVHSETSTGALNPIADLARICHEHGDTVALVDSVSGLAGAPVECDAWKLDVLLTGAQKALALPPGLAFAVAQPNILERAKAKKDRGIYFDFIEYEKYLAKHQTPNTPAVSLLFALDVQMQHLVTETIEVRWERHASMARRCWGWVEEMRAKGIGLSILSPEGARSPTVTCIKLPAGKNGVAIEKEMRQRGYVIGTGYAAMKDDYIRIGHMGDHTVEGLSALLDVLEQVLTS